MGMFHEGVEINVIYDYEKDRCLTRGIKARELYVNQWLKVIYVYEKDRCLTRGIKARESVGEPVTCPNT